MVFHQSLSRASRRVSWTSERKLGTEKVLPGSNFRESTSAVTLAMPGTCEKMVGLNEAHPRVNASSLAMIPGPLPDVFICMARVRQATESDLTSRETLSNCQAGSQTRRATRSTKHSHVC